MAISVIEILLVYVSDGCFDNLELNEWDFSVTMYKTSVGDHKYKKPVNKVSWRNHSYKLRSAIVYGDLLVQCCYDVVKNGS